MSKSEYKKVVNTTIHPPPMTTLAQNEWSSENTDFHIGWGKRSSIVGMTPDKHTTTNEIPGFTVTSSNSTIDKNTNVLQPHLLHDHRALTLPVHPSSVINYFQPNSRWTLKLITLLILLFHTAVGIALIVTGNYHLSMFTYWQYTLLEVFYICALVGFFVEGIFLSFLVLFIVPIVFSMTFMVYILIIILIAIDGGIFASHGTTDIGMVHLGDQLIHTFPLLGLFIMLVFDFKIIIRATFYHFTRSRPWWHVAIYMVYFLFSPMLLFGIYSAVFNPLEQYTDEISLGVMWGIGIALDIVFGFFWFLAFIQQPQADLVVYNFYRSAMYRKAVELIQSPNSKRTGY